MRHGLFIQPEAFEFESGTDALEFLGESEERETPRVRPLIRSICGEARGIRHRLLTPQGGDRRYAVEHARKWLRRTSNRWPYENLRELARHELNILAGCLYGVASAMGEEPEPYRRLRSDIGRLLGVPGGELEGEANSASPIKQYIEAGAEIRKQLQRNFRADDEAGYLDRRRRLRLAFQSVPKSFAGFLLEQLSDTSDPLAKLFRYKLHHATRSEMISILQKKLEVI